MFVSVLRWLSKNFSSLLMAFVLAVVVWISATTATDPNQEREYPQPISIQWVGLDPKMLIMGNPPKEARVVLNAPQSIWSRLSGNAEAIRAWVDLSDLGAGDHVVKVQVQVNMSPVRVISRDPETIEVTLEPLVTRPYTITLSIEGEPAIGYRAGDPVYSPTTVMVSGPDTLVSQVRQVRASLDITGRGQAVEANLPLKAYDANDQVINGLTLSPQTLNITEPINILGGYRNVIVKVITRGQVANGYKITNMTVSPPNVVVFSSDPALVNSLPGYVETKPVDLTGAQDDLELPVELNLPENVSAVNDPKVLVQVSIAAIESNLTMSLPVDVIGLAPGLSAQVAPSTVDVILSGPLPVLSALKPSDLRVVVDLSNMEIGVYQLAPKTAVVPDRVQVDSILPTTVEVTVIIAPTPTRTPTPFSVTPTPRR